MGRALPYTSHSPFRAHFWVLYHINSFLTPPQASFLQASAPPVTSLKQCSQSPVVTKPSRPLALISSAHFNRQHSQTHSTSTHKPHQSSVPTLQPPPPSACPPHHSSTATPQQLTFIGPEVPHEMLLTQLPLLHIAQPPTLLSSPISCFTALRSLLGPSQHSSMCFMNFLHRSAPEHSGLTTSLP